MPVAEAVAPRKMFPAPTTMATSIPMFWTAFSCPAIVSSMAGSIP